MATPSWKILYDEALHSDAVNNRNAHRRASEAIIERMKVLSFQMSVTVAHTKELRALSLALSDLRVLGAAWKAA